MGQNNSPVLSKSIITSSYGGKSHRFNRHYLMLWYTAYYYQHCVQATFDVFGNVLPDTMRFGAWLVLKDGVIVVFDKKHATLYKFWTMLEIEVNTFINTGFLKSCEALLLVSTNS
jgi:hypothetical protein